MSHLYVCHFSSGHIKVGRSIDPVARVAQHADRVACVGIELVEYRTFECAGDVFMAEAALIERCDTECTRRLKSEWFEGLTFESACEWACGCAKTDFQAAHMSKKTGIQIAVDKFDGSPSKLAEACGNGILRQHVEHWRKVGRVSAEHTPVVSAASGVPCELLNDRVNWSLVREVS